MIKRIQYIFKGIGSIMDITPSTDYNQFIPKETPAERMYGHWKRTGNHIKKAIECFANEQKDKK